MITVEEAKSILFSSVKTLDAKTCEVNKSLGHVLAEDIHSRFDIPQFDQSAVDGFAIYSGQAEDENHFEICGETKAGDPPVRKLKMNTAVRIYTGAAVPSNASSVVMQEKTNSVNGEVRVSSGHLSVGSNIRRKGSQVRAGELVLKKGTAINPAAIGFLYMLGLKQVKVIRKPVVGILSTGNELRKPGEKLSAGQIFESNSFTLEAALQQTGFLSRYRKQVADKRNLLLNSLKKMISDCDIVIISGGISVGKYDLVKEALEHLGVKELFYKVSQKPGKPMYAGKINNCLVFALPGNPAASLVCYYEYVLPALNMLSGFPEKKLETIRLPLAEPFESMGDRALFLKAKINKNEVVILDRQGSDMLRSFVEADALVYLPVLNRTISKAELVEVHILPQP